MIGVLIGAVGFGKMSDSLGRRPALLSSLATCLIGGIPLAFAPGKKLFEKIVKILAKDQNID